MDDTNKPLAGWSVSIDNTTAATTGTTGAYTANVPTIDIVPSNVIKVFDPNHLLAHEERLSGRIDTAILHTDASADRRRPTRPSLIDPCQTQYFEP